MAGQKKKTKKNKKKGEVVTSGSVPRPDTINVDAELSGSTSRAPGISDGQVAATGSGSPRSNASIQDPGISDGQVAPTGSGSPRSNASILDPGISDGQVADPGISDGQVADPGISDGQVAATGSGSPRSEASIHSGSPDPPPEEKDGVPANDTDKKPSEVFRRFLEGFTLPGTSRPLYQAQVASLKLRGCYKLEVNFDHLKKELMKNLKDRMYLDLIFLIINDTNSSHNLLQSVVIEFFKKHGHNSDGIELMKEAGVIFLNKPKSIKMFEDHLRSKPIRQEIGACGYCNVYATTHGKRSFLALLLHIFKQHRDRLSYSGLFEVSDIVIVDSEIWILATPEPFHCEKKSAEKYIMRGDLIRLWKIMEKHLSYVTVWNRLELPIQFENLKHDLLDGKSAVSEEWYRWYLEYHPALMSSRGRRNLANGIHDVTESVLGGEGPFIEVPLAGQDWRKHYTTPRSDTTDPALQVYYNSNNVDFEDQPPFFDTCESQVKFLRFMLEHLDIRNCITDMDETEYFATAELDTVLPLLLKKIAQSNELQRLFGVVVSHYEASRDDSTDLPIHLVLS